MAQTVKNLPAMRETQVLSLGREDPPGEEMATYPNLTLRIPSSILAWGVPGTEEPGGIQSMVLQSQT